MDFFLFIGSVTVEAATSKLKAAGTFYRQKMLESKPENWQAIKAILDDEDLVGVVARLNARNFSLFASPTYTAVGEELFESLGKTSHLMLVHESLITGHEDEPDPHPGDDETYMDFLISSGRFSPPPQEVRECVLEALERHSVSVVPYRTNAEMSLLAARFVDDHERSLLFRVYIPLGRLYSGETDRILSLFHDWLTTATGHRVRRDGYATASGRVYEFFGDETLEPQDLDKEFTQFSRFLDLSREEPSKAIDWLISKGIDEAVAGDLVTRYGKEAARLDLDIRQAREARLLSLRHRLEAELVDLPEGSGTGIASTGIAGLLPDSSVTEALRSTALNSVSGSPRDITVNQQIVIGSAEAIIQDVRGASSLGSEAQDLLRLIQKHADMNEVQLESDLYEFEDVDARGPDRLLARQRLKRFLMKLGGKVEDAAITTGIRYLESKVGLG